MLMLGKFRIGLSNLHLSELKTKEKNLQPLNVILNTLQPLKRREREKLKQEHAICRMIIKQCSNPV